MAMDRKQTVAAAAVILACVPLSGCDTTEVVPAIMGATAAPAATSTVETTTESGVADATTALDEFCAQQPGKFSVYLQDLSTGESYTYGAEAFYYGASTIKVPFALWLCEQADAGTINLDDTISNIFYGQTDLYADTTLEAYADSAAVPARTAMRAMLGDSDNNATMLLAAAWPATAESGFVDFVEKLGFSAADTCSVIEEDGVSGTITVTDLAAAMQALYSYMESDAPHAEFLSTCFEQAEYEALYLPTGYQAVHKYGSWDAAFHDAAIVYAPHPYLLCCMTDQGDREIDFPAAPVAAMQTLGKLVWSYLDR